MGSERLGPDGEYWCNWLDCICLPINPISDEMKRVLEEGLAPFKEASL
jgi:hypothetical protein